MHETTSESDTHKIACDHYETIANIVYYKIKDVHLQIEQHKQIENSKTIIPELLHKYYAQQLEWDLKLKKILPENLGQAGRISGVNPSDVALLSVAIKKREAANATDVSA